MNQQLLPEPKHSVHDGRASNIIALSVTFTAELMLGAAEIQTQLL
jgi:hypothetical protein